MFEGLQRRYETRSAIVYAPAVAGLVVLLMLAAYCFTNSSGHSGYDPRDGIPLYGVLAATGAGLWLVKARRAAVLALVVAALGAGFLLYVHHLMILRGYDHWASSGMPEQNPHAAAMLLLYGAVTVVALVGSWIGSERLG